MPPTVTSRAKDAYDLYKKVKKAKGYYESVKKVLDEDTRSGELFKVGLDTLMKLAEKATGTSLTSHPYFTYHKAHIQLLIQALNASDTYDHALQALQRAIQSADAAENLAKSLSDLTFRKNALKLLYATYLGGSLQLLRDVQTKPAQAAAQLRDAGQTQESLRSTTEDNLYYWRAQVCELYFDAARLLAMVDVEYRAAAAAMTRYNEKVKKLTQSKSSLDFIFGKRAEEEKQWAQFDREVDPSKGSAQAVEDPAGFAQRQRDKVNEVVDVLATICDVAMSDDAYNPDAVTRQIGNK